MMENKTYFIQRMNPRCIIAHEDTTCIIFPSFGNDQQCFGLHSVHPQLEKKSASHCTSRRQHMLTV